MKRFYIIAIIAALLSLAVLPASAEYTTLREVQFHILRCTDLIGSPSVHLSGTLIGADRIKDDLYMIRVSVDEDRALTPNGSAFPCFDGILWVGYALEDLPCSVGDPVEITGDVNSQYSSAMVPCIYIRTINGLPTF